MKVWDFLQDFVNAFENQLKEDDKRWGDTWLKRPREGQEERVENDIMDYFDKNRNGGQPVPWLKIIGNCYIAWIRENNPEIWDERHNKA